MDKRTLTALQGSIAKWEAIVWDGGEDRGVDNCPLCSEFYFSADCSGCPVAEYTGGTMCEDTPYVAWQRAFMREAGAWGGGVDAHLFVLDEATHKAAKDELAFLKSLLP